MHKHNTYMHEEKAHPHARTNILFLVLKLVLLSWFTSDSSFILSLHIYSTEHYRQTNTYIQAISEPQSRIHFKDICIQTNRHQLFGHNHIKQRRSGRIETFAETKRD